MLPTEHRLRSSRELRETSRRGQRIATRTVVLHGRLLHGTKGDDVRVGVVAGKKIGTAVVRNRVKRRLRHLLRPRVGRFPSSMHLVVRALPPAARASSAELAADLDEGLRRLGARLHGDSRSGVAL